MASSAGSKVKCFNFAITKSVVNIFTNISFADRSTNDLKHIKQDLSSNAWVWPPGWTEGFGEEAKINFFSELGHAAGKAHAATW